MMVDWGSLFLRLSFCLTMIIGHGYGKLMRLFGEGPIQFADPFGLGPTVSLALAVGGELIFPLIAIFGFKTRIVIIPSIITMLTAAFIAHADAPFFPAWVRGAVAEHPALMTPNKEYALLYLFGFVAIFFIGSGRFSLDKILSRN